MPCLCLRFILLCYFWSIITQLKPFLKKFSDYRFLIWFGPLTWTWIVTTNVIDAVRSSSSVSMIGKFKIALNMNDNIKQYCHQNFKFKFNQIKWNQTSDTMTHALLHIWRQICALTEMWSTRKNVLKMPATVEWLNQN